MGIIRITSILLFVLTAVLAAQATQYQSYNGSNNNVLHPTWGQAGVPFRRLSPCDYVDGVSKIRPGVSPRIISNIVFGNTTADDPSSWNHTVMMGVWGQFLAHNLAFAKTASTEPTSFGVPACDAVFDPHCRGNVSMVLSRTPYVNTTGCRDQINFVTEWIDGDLVYGNNQALADILREKSGGRLKSQHTNLGEFPPYNNNGVPLNNDGAEVNLTKLFLVGENRGNENPQLLALHILFLREHNRLANLFSQLHPDWNDEVLFQKARRCVSSYIQRITYKEWMKELLGTDLGEYTGYDPSVSPMVYNEFSVIAFRLGHSETNANVSRYNEDGTPTVGGPLRLRDVYHQPAALSEGLEPILRGMVFDVEQNIDLHVIEDMRNFLFPKNMGGFDLVARNIFRARDHGIPKFNAVRAAFGLPRYTSFDQISSDSIIQNNLRIAYNGDIDAVDPFVGALAEDHVPGAAVGPFIYHLLIDQFNRSRISDRFWYENPDLAAEVAICDVEGSTLSNIIVRNTNISKISSNVFVKRDNKSCSVTATLSERVSVASWIDYKGKNNSLFDLTITNTGSCPVNSVFIKLELTGDSVIENHWNLKFNTATNLTEVINFGGNLQSGASFAHAGLILSSSPNMTRSVFVSWTNPACLCPNNTEVHTSTNVSKIAVNSTSNSTVSGSKLVSQELKVGLKTATTEIERLSLLTNGDFVFDFTKAITGVSKSAGGKTVAATSSNFPAAIGHGVAMTVGYIEPCGINLPHSHPRATEINFIVSGKFQAGFFLENGAVFIGNTLTPGMATIFPQGSIHFEQNLNCEPAMFVASFNNEDPGVQTVGTSFFGLPVDIAAASVNVTNIRSVEDLASYLPENPALGLLECRQRCGL